MKYLVFIAKAPGKPPAWCPTPNNSDMVPGFTRVEYPYEIGEEYRNSSAGERFHIYEIDKPDEVLEEKEKSVEVKEEVVQDLPELISFPSTEADVPKVLETPKELVQEEPEEKPKKRRKKPESAENNKSTNPVKPLTAEDYPFEYKEGIAEV